MKFRVKLADHAANKRIHAIHSIADAMYSGGGESSVRMIQSNIVPLQLEDANGPDLIPRLTRTGTYSPGQDVIYHASLSNAGSVPTEGEMRMTLQFPEIVDVISVNNADWSCDEAGRQLQCRQTKSLGRGMSSTVVDIVARLGQSVQAEDSQYVEVSLVASGGGESGQAIVNNRVVDRAVIKKNLSVSGKVWLDMEGKRRLTNDAIMQQGWRAQLLSVSGSGRTAVVNVAMANT
jgi:hypothetical protein